MPPDAHRRVPTIKTSLWLVAVAPLALLVLAVCTQFPDFTEHWYGRGVYPVVAAIWANTTGRVPFHVGELLFYASLLLLLFVLVRGSIRIFRPSEKFPRAHFWRRLGATSLRVLGVVSCVVAALVLLWGLNYQRRTWLENNGVQIEKVEPARLAQVVDYLAAQVGSIRPTLNQNSQGAALPSKGRWGDREQLSAVDAEYARLNARNPLILGTLAPAKSLITPNLFSNFGLSGMLFPFTGEPIINVGPDCWSIPFSAAHEGAHQRGWAREDEANFIAFLVLQDSADPAFRYSAFLHAYLYCAIQLFSAGWTDETYWKEKRAIMGPGAAADRKAQQVYWQRYEGPLSKAGSAINDVYLKAQGQRDGILSYGRMVDLMIAWYFSDRMDT